MVMNTYSSFLQTLLWERFLVLAPKLVEFPLVITEEMIHTDDSKAMKMTGTQALGIEVAKCQATGQ